MINKTFVIVMLMLCSTSYTGAQILTLQQVIDKVLQNNFDVQLAAKDVRIAENLNTAGNAGLMPSVQLSTGANLSNNNTEIKFAGGIPDVNVKSATNTSYNGGVDVRYTVFNGFASRNAFLKLQLMEDLSDEQLNLTLENAIITSIGLYMDLARLQDDEQALKENYQLSEKRFKRMELSKSLGGSTNLDLLNAQIDRHTDSVALLTVHNQVLAIKRQLNMLMGTAINTEFQIQIGQNELPLVTLDESLNLAKSNNTALVLAELRKQVSELDMSISKANTMPKIDLNSSYGFNRAQNAAGIIMEQNNLGFNGGLTISIPIYNGGKIKTAMANAEIGIQKNELLKRQTELSIEKEVYDHWYNYLLQLELELLEKQNITAAKLMEERAAESFKMGLITSIEYRQAQLALLSAQNRLNAARYSAQKEAYHLLRLQGKLLKDAS